MVKNFNSITPPQGIVHEEYSSPIVKVVVFQPEGVLCSSVEGISHEEFSEGGYYEL